MWQLSSSKLYFFPFKLQTLNQKYLSKTGMAIWKELDSQNHYFLACDLFYLTFT
jgi:hypothetical protein